MIHIQQLTYHYPNSSEPALNKISLAVAAGEFILLTGLSGCGKSTLLRCLNGLVPHFSGGTIAGSVRVAGLDVLQAGPHALSHHVGFVQQNPEAQAVLDRVESEIAFGLENFAVPVHEMQQRVNDVLALLGLESLRQRPLVTLSGGERQRVAIATALVLQPKVLVLDEPTSQLDPHGAEEVLLALVRLRQQLNLTIVLAEHRLERVLPFVDRIVEMRNGRIMQNAPTPTAVARLSLAPPLVQLGHNLGWQPLPLTAEEAQPFVADWDMAKLQPKPASAPEEAAREVVLEVADLFFTYQSEPILQNISLTLHAGEAVAVLGRNGAGKTTLLQCVVGLLQSKAGEIWVNGRTTQGRALADICREVAYLPQNPDDLLFADSVADEFAITLRNHQLNPSAYPSQPLLEQLGLADVQDAYPRDLSVGQRQRVALGAVTITNPTLILLDEPTRGLDSAAKESLLAIWRGWLAQGKALLLVTHDVELAAQIAPKTVVLENGRILDHGPTAQILHRHPTFATQIARLFPGSGWLTPADVLANSTTCKPPNLNPDIPKQHPEESSPVSPTTMNKNVTQVTRPARFQV